MRLQPCQNDFMPQKDQQGTPQKLTSTRETMHQTEEKFAGAIAENDQMKRVEKKETMQDNGEPSASGKPPDQKVMMESKKETKESAEGKGKGNEKEKNSKFREADEGIHRKEDIESKGKRIKEVAASASQAITSLKKRFNEEDKQMLIYTSATVLIVAVGFYVSYEFRSSVTP